MKHLYKSLVILIILSLAAFTQTNEVPNASFETWTGGNPDGWYTSNTPALGLTPVTQTTDARTGSSAARGEIVNFMGNPFGPNLAPGSFAPTPIPISQNYAELSLWYKLGHSGAPGTIIVILATLLDAGGQPVASLQDTATVATNTFIEKVALFNYSGGSGNPATQATIQIALGGDAGFNIGDWFIVDDLEFRGIVTGITETGNGVLPQSYSLEQNYPNPFNPVTNIPFTVPKQSDVRLVVYNQLGQEVARLVEQPMQPGSYVVDWDAGQVSSGVYFYRMDAGNFSETRRMMLVK